MASRRHHSSSNSGGGGGRRPGKRKAGHIGFQSSEIAFIEDEMAALAAEYGLEIEQDVAANVSHRRESKKKARLRRHQQQQQQPSAEKNPGATASTGDSGDAPVRTPIRLPRLPQARALRPTDFDRPHALVMAALEHALPDGIVVAGCAVPGCNCSNGRRELVLDDQEDTEDGSTDSTSERDVLLRARCKKCHHGVLQHQLHEEDPSARPSGGQRFLAALAERIRTGRLAGSVFRSRVWVASSLALVTELVQHLRKQFAAGGTQNGQKTIAELQEEQALLAAMHSLLKKAETASQKAVSRDELPIELASAFDQMYFQVYYAMLVLYGRACAAVPGPECYLRDLESYVPEALAMAEAFVNQELHPDDVPATLLGALALGTTGRKGASASGTNALLEIHHLRLREGIRLFYEQGIGMHGEMDALLSNAGGVLTGHVAAKQNKKPGKKNFRRERGKDEPTTTTTTALTSTAGAASGENKDGFVEVPAYELLAQWRNNCRDWCCHLFAYATPTAEALGVLAKYAPLVEIGAGTGYWSSLLQQRGVDAIAYDVCPPSIASSSGADGDDDDHHGPKSLFPKAPRKKAGDKGPTRNEYHGQVPTFGSVARGGPEVLRRDDAARGRTLFLCYPPPHDEMARQCLRQFTGEHVIYVGEWQGDTATRSFERALARGFVLVEELELPNWGNSAYSLTVWRRRRRRSAAAAHDDDDDDRGTSTTTTAPARLTCFHCHAEGEDDGDLKRCVLCKTNVYCSAECATAGRRAHAAEHATRLVFLEDEARLDFDNDLHYKPLAALHGGDDDEEDEDEDEEDKVVVSRTSWKSLKDGPAATAATSNNGNNISNSSSSGGGGGTGGTGGFAFNFATTDKA